MNGRVSREYENTKGPMTSNAMLYAKASILASSSSARKIDYDGGNPSDANARTWKIEILSSPEDYRSSLGIV